MADESIPEGETPNQKQARLRRERRNAKIAAGGSSRLEAITQLSGRQHAAQKEGTHGTTNTSQLVLKLTAKQLQQVLQHPPNPSLE